MQSLYTNIPNEEEVNVNKEPTTTKPKQGNNGNHSFPMVNPHTKIKTSSLMPPKYLQLSGVAMGTKCAVIYGNLFMSYFEENYIYNLINNECSFYKRFIDDIFIIWKGTLNDLKTFVG